MITEIAWKNVWRNKTRSLTVIAAVAVGVFAGVFAMAAINSSVVQRIDAAVNDELSHIQINNKDFRSSGDIRNIMTDYHEVTSVLINTPGVTNFIGRIIIRGVASTSAKSTGVEITGIDIEKEKEMFTLSGKLIPGTGSYFGPDTRTGTVLKPVFIGEKLAKDLNIIRYMITADVLKQLGDKGVPAGVVSKLAAIQNQRFTSDKRFNRAIGDILTAGEL
jgi:putative ABC transport system permease protein